MAAAALLSKHSKIMHPSAKEWGKLVLHHGEFEMHCLRSSSACSSIPAEVFKITTWSSPQASRKPASPGSCIQGSIEKQRSGM